MARLGSGGLNKTSKVNNSMKDVIIKHNGITIEATLHFQNNELNEIKGEFFILESQIVNPIDFEPTFTFWSKKYGYSSTWNSLFEIISERHKNEIIDHLNGIIDEQEKTLRDSK